MSVVGAQPQCPWGHRPLWADLLLREPRLRRALPAVAPATPSSSASPAVWGEEEVESGSLGVGFKSAKQEPCSVRKAWAFTCPFSLRAWKTRHSRNAADTVFENTQYSERDAAGTEHELAGFESERGCLTRLLRLRLFGGALTGVAGVHSLAAVCAPGIRNLQSGVPVLGEDERVHVMHSCHPLCCDEKGAELGR
ncbi:hypothetical protein CB1_000149010 [Camelus ferus]|nr:hypothetical protein CB1_000149010 [Camelus ferus]